MFRPSQVRRSTIEAGGQPHSWADMPLFPRLYFQLSLVPPRVSGKLLPPKPESCGPALEERPAQLTAQLVNSSRRPGDP